MTQEHQEITVDEAMAVLRADYYREIRSIVDEMKQCVKDGEIDSIDGAYDWLHETLDGHEYVIYTQKAKRVIMLSDNDDAWGEMEPEIKSEDPMKWSRMAYAAMDADCREEIDLEELEMLLDPENDDDDDEE